MPLRRFSPARPKPPPYGRGILAEWTAWNTVRTIVPIVSAILFTAALI